MIQNSIIWFIIFLSVNFFKDFFLLPIALTKVLKIILIMSMGSPYIFFQIFETIFCILTFNMIGTIEFCNCQPLLSWYTWIILEFLSWMQSNFIALFMEMIMIFISNLLIWCIIFIYLHILNCSFITRMELDVGDRMALSY